VLDVPSACAAGLLLVCEYQELFLVPLNHQEYVMSIGSFVAGSLIFVGKTGYKAAVRSGTLLSEGSEDFSARWDDPEKGFDAAINKVDADEIVYQQRSAAKRAARAAAVALLQAPATPATPSPAPVAVVS
jgi:hypothetical protein